MRASREAVASRTKESRAKNVFFDERVSFCLVGSFDPSLEELPIVFLARKALLEAERVVQRQKDIADYAFLAGRKHGKRFFILDELVHRDVDRVSGPILGVVRLGSVDDWSPGESAPAGAADWCGFALCFPQRPRSFLERAGTSDQLYHPKMGYGPDEQGQARILSGFFICEKTDKIPAESPRPHEVGEGAKRAIRVEVPTRDDHRRRRRHRTASKRSAASAKTRKVKVHIAAPDRGQQHRNTEATTGGPMRVKPRPTRVHVPLREGGESEQRHRGSREREGDGTQSIRCKLRGYPEGLVVGESKNEQPYLCKKLKFKIPGGRLEECLEQGTEIFGKISLGRAADGRDEIELWLTDFAGFQSRTRGLDDEIEGFLNEVTLDSWPGFLWLRWGSSEPEVDQRKLEERRHEVERVADWLCQALKPLSSKIPEPKRHWLFISDVCCYVYDGYLGKYRYTYEWNVKESALRHSGRSIGFVSVDETNTA